MEFALAIFLILLLLGIVYYLTTQVADSDTSDSSSVEVPKTPIERAEKFYQNTIGYEFDDNAKVALANSEQAEDEYSQREAQGTLPRAQTGNAANSSFITASLYNYNLAPNLANPDDRRRAKRRAAAYFNKTIDRIARDPLGVDLTTPQPVEFLVDRAQDFWDDYLLQVQADDPEIIRNIYVPNFDVVRNTVREVKAATLPKQQYYQRKPIPSDPQNVHDSQINNDMRALVRRIHQPRTARQGGSSFKEIVEAVQSFPFSNEHKRQVALEVVGTMSKGRIPTSLDVSESELLQDVWERINSEENHSRRGPLREAFMNSLTECNEDGRVICTMGRCARVLSSLTLLDADSEVAKPLKTTEVLRSEAFFKAHQIVQNTLKEQPPEVVAAYNNPNVENEATAEQVSNLEAQLRTAIETTLRRDYRDVKPTVLNGIISDALAGV
jgi:hypothetical protein